MKQPVGDDEYIGDDNNVKNNSSRSTKKLLNDDEDYYYDDDVPTRPSAFEVYKGYCAQIFLALDNDESSTFAFYLGLFVKIVIIFAIMMYILSSLPSMNSPPADCTQDIAVCYYDPNLCPDYAVCIPEPYPIFGYSETAAVAFFSLDYVLRVGTSWSVSSRIAYTVPSNWKIMVKRGIPLPEYSAPVQMFKYAARIPNLIDAAAIAPFYLGLIIRGGGGAFMRVLRLFRLVRVLRLLKALTFLKNVDVTIALISITIRKSSQTLIVFMFFIMIVCILFACIIFMTEQGTYQVSLDFPQGTYVTTTPDNTAIVKSAFISIPTCMYWTFYTDAFPPVTPAGRTITATLALIAILGLAFPVGVIGLEFELAYRTETQKLMVKSQEKKRQKLMELKAEKAKRSTKGGSSRRGKSDAGSDGGDLNRSQRYAGDDDLNRSGRGSEMNRSRRPKSDVGSGDERSEGGDSTTATENLDIPPPLPPLPSPAMQRVIDQINSNITLVTEKIAALEATKEMLLDYDDLRERGMLPKLDPAAPKIVRGADPAPAPKNGQ